MCRFALFLDRVLDLSGGRGGTAGMAEALAATIMAVESMARGAVIIALESLSDDPGWTRVPPNHIVRVERDLEIAIDPL